MAPPPIIRELVRRFTDNQDRYTDPEYKEARLRNEFLDVFFGALGWNVANTQGYSEAFKEVVIEDALKVEGAARSPDYAFRIGGQTQFYAEAKKPSVDLKTDPEPAFQLRSYAWTKKLPVSVLTDFQELAIYDTRVRPKAGDHARTARIAYFTFEEYEARWEEIASLLSNDAIQRGSLERFVSERGLKKGYAEVDDVFLSDIEEWRSALAKEIYRKQQDLPLKDLNFAVQRTLDRIIFLRICEDRGIEPFGRLQEAAKRSDVYRELAGFFRDADNRYNSGLFHFRHEKARQESPDSLTLTLAVDDKTLRKIILGLYPPQSPYAFKVLPADILGQVYERFLGNTIVLKGHRIAVQPKPEVRKAGGVYYTPTFVVDHIVRETVGHFLAGKSPREIAGLAVLDPACGSGSFLLHAYEVLLQWYLEWYTSRSPERRARGRSPALRRTVAKGWQLTSQEKKRILLRHIYGVDIDSQAVEVTKLSLLLRVLEEESHEQLALLHERALPDLGNNIKCGNSLISPEFYKGAQLRLLDEAAPERVNAFDWQTQFPDIMENGGFNVVIGNPPYVLLQDEFRDDDQLDYFRTHYGVAAFKIDTYHLFIERGLSLTRSGGRCAMITPTNFLTNNHLTALRRLFLETTRIASLFIVEKGVFKGISVDNAVFVAELGGRSRAAFAITHVQPSKGKFVEVGKYEVAVKAALASENVLFTGAVDADLAKVWEKVQKASAPLGSLAYVNFGKQLRDRKKYLRDVIEVESLRALPGGYRPCYTGSDVQRYTARWHGLACRTSREAQRGGCWDSEKQDSMNKLLTKQVGRYPDFGIDTYGYQCLNTIFMVNVMDGAVSPLFLLGCLNSRIVRAWWLDKFFDQRRTFPKIKGTYLKRLPIPTGLVKTIEARIEELVVRRLELSEKLQASNVADQRTRIEREIVVCEGLIDDSVGEAYGLSEKEQAHLDAVLS